MSLAWAFIQPLYVWAWASLHQVYSVSIRLISCEFWLWIKCDSDLIAMPTLNSLSKLVSIERCESHCYDRDGLNREDESMKACGVEKAGKSFHFSWINIAAQFSAVNWFFLRFQWKFSRFSTRHWNVDWENQFRVRGAHVNVSNSSTKSKRFQILIGGRRWIFHIFILPPLACSLSVNI